MYWKPLSGSWSTLFFAFFLVHFLVFGRLIVGNPERLRMYPCGWTKHGAKTKWDFKSRAEHLFCTPTYAMRLTSFAKDRGFDLSGHRLKSIIVAGETGGSLPAVRNRITSIWGDLAIHDHYGMTEVGPVAYEKPGGQGGSELFLILIIRR